MSSSRSILESLSSLASSSNYSSSIKLQTEMDHWPEYKSQFESISSIIEIPPPNVWFSIDQNKCLGPIKNDIERSRVSREGILYTSMKGHLMNRIIYDLEEDIGTLQETQQSFCASFAVVKDTCDQYIKRIDSQLKLCFKPTRNLIDQSHLKVSQLDQISKQIYSKYRIFLIFDCKAQPGRILSIQSCFYPDVRFSIERIKKKDKEGLKFAPSEVLSKVQRGEIMNEFGFLSFDSKKRLLMIKKDDPEISKDYWVGVWVIGSFPLKRTKKQFSKEDAIWYSLLQYYSNPDIKNKISIVAKQKGFLCYFGLKKQKQKLDSPEYYFFQPSPTSQPKWSFVTKSEFVSQWNRPLQVEIDLQNNTIMEEKEYSEISDQQIPKTMKSQSLKGNNSGISGGSSSQSHNASNLKAKEEQDQKDKIIKQLRAELQKCQQRCSQLDTINKFQEKMLKEAIHSPLHYPQQPMYPYASYPYPYPYPPVNPQGYQQMQPNPPPLPFLPNQNDNKNRPETIKDQTIIRTGSPTNRKSDQAKPCPEPQQRSTTITFPSDSEQESEKVIEGKQQLFIKKGRSHEEQIFSNTEPQIFENKNSINFSFADSDEPRFSNINSIKKDSKPILQSDEKIIKSPQFKRHHSLNINQKPNFKDHDSSQFLQQFSRIDKFQLEKTKPQKIQKQNEDQEKNYKSTQSIDSKNQKKHIEEKKLHKQVAKKQPGSDLSDDSSDDEAIKKIINNYKQKRVQ